MRKIHIILIFLIGFCTNVAHAQKNSPCSLAELQVLATDSRTKELGATVDSEKVVAAACKVWPYKPNLLLMAVAYEEKKPDEKKLLLAIQDTKQKRIVNFYERTIEEDGKTKVDSDSFRFDTAKFDLRSDIRAFGLVFQSSARGPNCADVYYGDELTLFVPEKSTFRRVLTINRSWQRWIKGCPSAMDDSISEEAWLNLTISSTTTNGFNNIRVLAYDSPPSPSRAPPFDSHLLRFDGKTYRTGPSPQWWLSDVGSSFSSLSNASSRSC